MPSGALMQLVSYGSEDLYLTGNPQRILANLNVLFGFRSDFLPTINALVQLLHIEGS